MAVTHLNLNPSNTKPSYSLAKKRLFTFLHCPTMLIVHVTYIFLFGIAAAVDKSPQISTTTNNNGKCYTLHCPENQCMNDSDQKLSSRLDAVISRLDKQYSTIVQQSVKLQNHIKEQTIRIKALEDTLKENGLALNKETCKHKYRDCADHQLAGLNTSGEYTITPEHVSSPLSVWCDMETEKGGWTVFQRRQDGSVDFYRDWAAYKKGFGNINGEYWLGNDNIYRLTIQKRYQLRVDLLDFDGKHFWAEYDDFWIDNENAKYKMHVGTYKGTAGDALTRIHSGMRFSTLDRDNDAHWGGSCAKNKKGGFWYWRCADTNLNGIYYPKNYTKPDSIYWWPLTKGYKNLKKTELKIRPVAFDKNE